MNRNPLLRFWFNVLFWSFGRGTWQYDILCGAIMVFLFLTPTSMFFSGIEKDPFNPVQKIVELQKIHSDLYLLIILNPNAKEAGDVLDKKWQDFDKRTQHHFARKAFYDEKGHTLGYILSSP